MRTKVDVAAPVPSESIESPPTEEWQLTQRIVASPGFVRSALLTSFLLYVCDRKLHGREDEINESEVGTRALGRPSSFHPGEDNIVRTYARMLRKRLEEYFETQGRDEPTRIVIPRGQYIPIFEANLHEPSSRPSPDVEAVPTPETSDAPRRSAPAAAHPHPTFSPRWIAAIILLALAIATAAWFFGSHRARSADLYATFWTTIFDPQRTTDVVTGDSGFAMLQDMTGIVVHLHDYVSGDPASKFPTVGTPGQEASRHFGADRYANYTSVADLNSVVSLTRLPQFAHGRVKILYARDLRMDDLKGSNVILFGGPHANPWVELFEPSSAFRMVFPSHLDGMHLDERSIVNKHPRAGEQAEYSNRPSDDAHETYTILSYLPNVDGQGHALLLEGENMAGTQAAADFVMNEPAMTPVLQRARLRDGSIGPFELLLETRTVGASAPEARPVVERYGMSQ
jgi:hypothetical protein